MSAVGLLRTRGRFLVAEPVFDSSAPRGGAPVVDLGDSRARPGQLVLLGAGKARKRGGGPARPRVLRVIGRPDVARDVIEALMLDRGLRRSFAPDVEHEARAAADGPDPAAATGARRDLRDLPTFTIDPADARDFDDAVSAQRLDDGTLRVWVHIADVSAHVPLGGALDREARRRATSVYVPGAVEPMLPRALSDDACSLRPHVDRRAVTVQLDLLGDVVARRAFYRSLIRSDARLDYDGVDEIFAGRRSAERPWGDALAVAREAARALGAAREQRRGALELDRPEPEFEFDERGEVTAVHRREQTESHRLIEHLMIAANEAVALHLQQRGVPTLYRVHDRPEPLRVQRLVEQLASLSVATPPVPEPLSSTQAAALLGEISERVGAHVRRTGHGAQALTLLVLRTLMQAYYSPRNIGHSGLGSPCYCHFTSPIRRYPDIVCHRALLSTLGEAEAAPRAGELTDLGEWTSECERAAMIVERDGDDVALCFALQREADGERSYDGEVTGLIGAGAFIVFGDGFEGMLPVRRMPGRDWWELNEQGTVMHGSPSGATLSLGDPIAVRVHRIDPLRGRVDLEPAA